MFTTNSRDWVAKSAGALVRMRAKQYYDDDDVRSGSMEGSGSETEDQIESDQDSGSNEGAEEEHHSGNGGGSDEYVRDQMASVSFGALKKAQEALSRKRKRGTDTNEEHEDKLEALRQRLRQIKAEKASSSARFKSRGQITPGMDGRDQVRRAESDLADKTGVEDDEEDDSESNRAPSEEDTAPSKARTSKHAPTAQSSRHQVSRKRTVVSVPKSTARDPRFDSILSYRSHSDNSNRYLANKAYAFLDDYQRSEIAELKAALQRTHSDDDRAVLRRKINSMENRLKAKADKERQQEVLRQHRREEREKVKQGKTPYYLKEKELKERALVERFRGMKKRERDKAVERRKRRESQKERRRMPRDRRGTIEKV